MNFVLVSLIQPNETFLSDVCMWRCRFDGGAGTRAHSLRRSTVLVSTLPEGVQDQRVSVAPREPQQVVRPCCVVRRRRPRPGAHARPEASPCPSRVRIIIMSLKITRITIKIPFPTLFHGSAKRKCGFFHNTMVTE